jgi:GNAT superfamily N-acetyltransferase
MVIVDSLTPDPFVARLALNGYAELTPTLQMVLDGPLAARPARATQSLEFRAVTTDDDWQSLYPLVRANHIEGSSSHHLELDAEVTGSTVAVYRSKTSVSRFFLVRCDEVVCAYGSAVVAPYGMGIVENLFTLQEYRRRGIANAIISHAVDYARERGMGPMLIGPHVTETPKTFYAALGFVPQCVTRQYFREV